MRDLKNSKGISRYVKIEIIFFIVFFFLFPIITDIEYILKEKPCQQCPMPFTVTVIHRLVFGFFQILPFWFLYKYILHKLLLKKKYLYFLGAFTLFLFAFDLYIVYVEYLTISKLTFLPASITKDAGDWFKIKTLFHFSVIYVIQETLVFAALAYFINYAKQEEKMNALRQAKLQSDLDYLKAQVQPHFFFNTLNNIYSLALQRSEATAPLVAGLSDMMRYVLYETANQKVLLKKEIEFLKNYVNVEAVRHSENISISFDTQGIDDNLFIEPLLLLPLIENMFKHGIQHETGNGFIEIVIFYAENTLTLQAKNSKSSDKIDTTVEKGIGLANVQKRLELLYPRKYNMEINETDNYYELVLTLQLN